MIQFLKKYRIWVIWGATTVAILGYLAWTFFWSDDKRALLPGITSNGHHQIEERCDVCHVNEPTFGQFTASGVTNKACLSCHDTDLELANDSHPAVKFRNPENAVFLAKIDATQCIACHIEHQDQHTGEMGLTVPADYCAHCHQVTLENRPTHRGLGFETCATAGCHNFHDNLALFERFLLDHAEEPAMLAGPRQVPAPELVEWMLANRPSAVSEALAETEADQPSQSTASATLVSDWAETAHASAGVNCTACHTDTSGAWQEQPHPVESCASCHPTEKHDFESGKHGMRLAAELSPMKPSMARLPMKRSAMHQELSCVSCHDAHRFDRQHAAVDACLQCHDDDHSRNYVNSSHFQAWKLELDGHTPEGTGVSCATCHLPREARPSKLGEDARVVVQHNQNSNLTPNEKMVRNVCNRCHGLQFTLDSLASRELIDANFSERPKDGLVESIHWATEATLERGSASAKQTGSIPDKDGQTATKEMEPTLP